MTTMSTVEVTQYLVAVEAALSDLDPEVREDLLEDLPSHLEEVAAEGNGSLFERLGDPLSYAQELRAAAGLMPDAQTKTLISGRAASMLQTATALAVRANRRGGRLVGYSSVRAGLQAIRPPTAAGSEGKPSTTTSASTTSGGSASGNLTSGNAAFPRASSPATASPKASSTASNPGGGVLRSP